MPDRLYVSYWVRGATVMNMLRHVEKALAVFPFSKLTNVEPVLRIYAVSYSETPVLEAALPNPPEPAAIVEAARDFELDDACVQVETFWDLWDFDTEWAMRPSRVLLEWFGPGFRDAERGETARVDFGLESRFLPDGDRSSLAMVRGNVQSLLRLVHDLDEALPVEKRLLWSESGDNFAGKLGAALETAEPQP
jgi:hypothetical protein